MQGYRQSLYAAALLGGFSLLGLGWVSLVHENTAARIEANQRAVLLRTLKSLLPAADFDNDLPTDAVQVRAADLDPAGSVTVYRARKGTQPIAAIFTATAPDGYNGAIRLLVAVRAGGVLAGVRVLAHRETPGLGDPVEVEKSGWILGFGGRSLANPPPQRWKVKRDGGDFDQFTGATVTPRAVVGAVRKTLEYFGRNRDWLFSAAPAM